MVKIFYDIHSSNEAKKQWLPRPFEEFVLGSKIPYPFPVEVPVELIHPASGLPNVSFGVEIRVRDIDSGARGASGVLTFWDKGGRSIIAGFSLDEEGYPTFAHNFEDPQKAKDIAEGLEEFEAVVYHSFIVLEMFKIFRPRVLVEKEAYSEAKKRRLSVSKNDYILELTPEKIKYIREKQKEAEEEHEKRTNRYHMARGHYRHYKSGKVVWVKAHYKGDKSKGVINKDYMLTAAV